MTTTTMLDNINPISLLLAILLEYIITVLVNIITYTTIIYTLIIPSDISKTLGTLKLPYPN